LQLLDLALQLLAHVQDLDLLLLEVRLHRIKALGRQVDAVLLARRLYSAKQNQGYTQTEESERQWTYGELGLEASDHLGVLLDHGALGHHLVDLRLVLDLLGSECVL
jgi:hypothetical protein